MANLTLYGLLLNVVVPLLVAGVLVWLLTLPSAPFDATLKGALRWVVIAIVVVWILFWLLSAFGAGTPTVRTH